VSAQAVPGRGLTVGRWRPWPAATLLIAFLLLGGCATRAPVVEGPDLPEIWVEHETRVLALEQWTLTGRIALEADGQQWHANLRWRERNGDYDIQFFGPFGRDGGRLQGDEQGVSLRTSDGERFYAPDADRLVRDVLGWRLPVSGLRYWVLGLPAPGAVDGRLFDTAGRLSLLEQTGWRVQFQRYRDAPAPALPDRLELRYGEEIRLRLLIDAWVIEH